MSRKRDAWQGLRPVHPGFVESDAQSAFYGAIWMPSGRPILVPRVVGVRVDEVAGRRLQMMADERGISTSDVMRAIIYDALKGRSPIAMRRRRVPHGDLLAAILAQLGKTGSNLNQLARSANSGWDVDRSKLERALLDVSDMSRLLRDLIGGVDDA